MHFCSNYNFLIYHAFILKVSAAKSSTLNCSARLSKISCCKISSLNKLRTALRNFFLRWLNAVFTRRKKSFSAFIDETIVLFVNSIIPLITFGGGLNDDGETSNRYFTL